MALAMAAGAPAMRRDPSTSRGMSGFNTMFCIAPDKLSQEGANTWHGATSIQKDRRVFLISRGPWGTVLGV